MPTLIEKPSGWYIVENTRVGGKSVRSYLKTLGKISKEDARDALTRFKDSNGRGRSGRSTVSDLFDEYHRANVSARGHGANRQHKYVLEQIQETVGHIQLRNLEYSDLEYLKGQLGTSGGKRPRSGRTIKILLGYLISVLKFGHRLGWVGVVPPMPKVRVDKKPIHRLYPSEVEKLLNACDHEIYRKQQFFVQILLGTGLRPNELDLLDWSDVDLPRRRITIRQTREFKRGGVIPIPDDVLNVLVPVAQRSGRVCPYPSGGYIKAMQRLSSRVGLKFSAGTFRKTFASIMFSRGVDIHTVAKILRHDPATTLKWYAEFEIDHLAGAMEFNPLASPGTNSGTQNETLGDSGKRWTHKSELS